MLAIAQMAGSQTAGYFGIIFRKYLHIVICVLSDNFSRSLDTSDGSIGTSAIKFTTKTILGV